MNERVAYNWIAIGGGVGFLIVQESEADGIPSLRGHFPSAARRVVEQAR